MLPGRHMVGALARGQFGHVGPFPGCCGLFKGSALDLTCLQGEFWSGLPLARKPVLECPRCLSHW